jgi:hypothetical protein
MVTQKWKKAPAEHVVAFDAALPTQTPEGGTAHHVRICVCIREWKYVRGPT